MGSISKVLTLALTSILTTAITARAAPEAGEPVDFDAGLAWGAWPDAVTIEVPPASRGTQPKVQLIASHTTVDGELGNGWRLLASSAITRHSTTGGAPNYTSADLYRLDGVDLVSVTTPAPTHYEPKEWDGSQLTYASASNTWTRKRDGWTWTYGSTAGTGVNATKLLVDSSGNVLLKPVSPYGACVTTLCKTSTWYLSKVEDPFGNVATYDYQIAAIPASLTGRYAFTNSRQFEIKTITYGGGQNTIDFAWDVRPDTRFVVESGRATLRVERLKVITTKVGSTTYSRYAIQYEDEYVGGTTKTPIATPLTDCDGTTLTATNVITRPGQSVIRKVTRIGSGAGNAPSPQHTLRCVKSRHETSTWQTDAEARVIDEIEPPTSNYDITQETALPMVANLDSDGVSDLVVIGVGASTFNVRAYVATPDLVDRPFATAANVNTPGQVAAMWQTQIDNRIDLSDVQDGDFALIDVDDDKDADLVWLDNGTVKVDRYNGFTYVPQFSTETLGLTECQLENADFGDIDGDGYPDAIIRANSHNGCNEPVSYWLRNNGAAPWFTSATHQNLKAPLELATPPSAWTSILNGVCGGAVTPPTDFNDAWTGAPEAYVADHMRVADFNQDGIADLAYALYGCWYLAVPDSSTTSTVNETDWNTVSGSAYSQIFFGDGKGNFLESGLSAGPPLTWDLDDAAASNVVTGRITNGMLMPLDADRDGMPELFSTAIGIEGSAARMRTFIGLDSGWGASSDINVSSGGLIPDGLVYLSAADECYRRVARPAIGDFDGDGMVDILTLDLDESGVSACTQGEWCAILHDSKRTGSEARTLSSDGVGGGRTSLTWGWSAQNPNDNEELRANVEVIAAVDGVDGVTTFTYSGAFSSGRETTPFAQVDRENARGGVDQFEFITAPFARGKPTHAARFRTDGTLEHLSVFVHGQLYNGSFFLLNYGTPYFNPLVRQCEYEVGNGDASHHQTVDVGSLAARCYDFAEGGLIAAGSEVMAGSMIIPNKWAPVVDGQTSGHLIPGSQGAYEAAFGVGTRSYGTITLQAAWHYNVLSWSKLVPGFLRWATPSDLSGVVPGVQSAQNGYSSGVELGATKVVEFIQDWAYDDPVRKLLSSAEYRDTSTSFDDRDYTYVFNQPDATGNWYTLQQEEVRSDMGALLAKHTRTNFTVGKSFTPTTESFCGSDGVTCRNHTYGYDSHGELLSHTHPDLGVESWTRGTCGQPLTHTDQVGRVRTETYDAACRRLTSTFQGATSSWARDNLGRITTLTVSPGGGAPSSVQTSYYDDAFTYREDSSFLEPRVGSVRGDGQLTLTYQDGFGRITRRTQCKTGGSTSGQSGVQASVRCLTGTERTIELNLYGSDGLRKVWTEPFSSGETPVTHGLGHDGFGRTVVELEPAHETSPAWLTTTHKRGADWLEDVEPIGRTIRTTRTTLSRETTVDGTRRVTSTYDRMGRLFDVTRPDGLITRYGYDVLGNVETEYRIVWNDCISGAAPWLAACYWSRDFADYDAVGRLTREIDEANVEREYTYDAAGRILSTTVEGVLIESRHYHDVLPASAPGTLPAVDITDDSGATITVHEDGLARTIELELLETTSSATWGANGRPATIVDRNGRATSFGYDTYDRVTTVTRPGGVATTLAYTTGDRLASSTDADGVVMSHAYTYAGDLASTTRGGFFVERSNSFDAAGRVIDAHEEGIHRIFAYDHFDRVTEVLEGVDTSGVAAQTIDLLYDAGDRPTSRTVTAETGAAVTELAYDDWGELVSVTDPLDKVWIIDRDILGRERYRRDPLGIAYETEYDDRGRVTYQGVAQDHRFTAFLAGQSFDGVDQLLSIERWDGADAAQMPVVKRRTYVDALGRTIADVERDGTVHAFEWSGDELVSESWRDAGGAVLTSTEYDYDADTGRLTRASGPHAPADAAPTIDFIEYAYTGAGRISDITTPEQVTSFAYDAGLISTESWDDQIRTFLRLDPEVTWPTAEELSGAGQIRRRDYTRDALGRIVSETVTAPGASTVINTRASHDAYGHPWLETRTVDGILEATTAWTYDPAGQPLDRTLTMNVGVPDRVSWTWLDNGSLGSVTTASGESFAYDYGVPADRFVDRVYDPSGAHADYAAITRNGRGQPTEITSAIDGTTRSMTYDAVGRMLTRESGPTAAAPTFLTLNTYDALGHLIGETFEDSSGQWTNTYGFDGRGRLIDEVRGQTGEHRRYTWSAGGNLLLGEMETSPGSFTAVMDADYDGQTLTAVNGTAISYDPWQGTTLDQQGDVFTYTADGEIRSIAAAATPTSPVTLMRDPRGLPVAHLEGGVAPRQISYGLDSSALPLQVRESDKQVRTYVTSDGELLGALQGNAFVSAEADRRGTPVRVASSPLDLATAFGAGAAAPAATDERFLYARLEGVAGITDVHLARHRSYDAETGRFQQPDPIDLDGGPHRFLYGGGDPVDAIDPMGWDACFPAVSAPNLGAPQPGLLHPVPMDSGVSSVFDDSFFSGGSSEHVVSTGTFGNLTTGSGGPKCDPGLGTCPRDEGDSTAVVASGASDDGMLDDAGDIGSTSSNSGAGAGAAGAKGDRPDREERKARRKEKREERREAREERREERDLIREEEKRMAKDWPEMHAFCVLVGECRKLRPEQTQRSHDRNLFDGIGALVAGIHIGGGGRASDEAVEPITTVQKIEIPDGYSPTLITYHSVGDYVRLVVSSQKSKNEMLNAQEAERARGDLYKYAEIASYAPFDIIEIPATLYMASVEYKLGNEGQAAAMAGISLLPGAVGTVAAHADDIILPIRYYTRIDGRPLAAAATLTRDLLRTGARPIRDTLPGWRELIDPNRGHLIARVLGGCGLDINLVSLESIANQRVMWSLEKSVVDAVESGATVELLVVPVYTAGKQAPEAIYFQARSPQNPTWEIVEVILNDVSNTTVPMSKLPPN